MTWAEKLFKDLERLVLSYQKDHVPPAKTGDKRELSGQLSHHVTQCRGVQPSLAGAAEGTLQQAFLSFLRQACHGQAHLSWHI